MRRHLQLAATFQIASAEKEREASSAHRNVMLYYCVGLIHPSGSWHIGGHADTQILVFWARVVTNFSESEPEAADRMEYVCTYGHIFGPYVSDYTPHSGHPSVGCAHHPVEFLRKPFGAPRLPVRHDAASSPDNCRIRERREQTHQPAFTYPCVVV